MALKILTNQVWRDAAQIDITDSSHVTTADAARALNCTGGHRGLLFTYASSSDRIVSYINKNGGLSADTIVVPNAHNFNGHEVRVRYYTTYSSSSTDVFSTSTFAETLVGIRGRDWVGEFSAVTNKQAWSLYLGAGTGGSYTKIFPQVYFCQALSLSYPAGLEITPLPFRAVEMLDGVPFNVVEKITLKFSELTSSEVQSLTQLYKLHREPLFIYDSAGDWFFDNLFHGIITDLRVGEKIGTTYEAQMDLARLFDSATITH